MKFFLKYLSKGNAAVLSLFNNIALLLAAAMTVVITIQVLFRYCFNSALPWPEEAARFMMVWMTFLVIPHAYRNGLNVNMQLFIEKVPQKIRFIIDILLQILIITSVVVCFSEGWKMTVRGTGITTSTLGIKMSYIYAILPISFGMMAIIGCEKFLKTIHNLFVEKTA